MHIETGVHGLEWTEWGRGSGLIDVFPLCLFPQNYCIVYTNHYYHIYTMILLLLFYRVMDGAVAVLFWLFTMKIEFMGVWIRLPALVLHRARALT